MAKVQKNKDGSKTYYPAPGENRTGTSYNQGKTYTPSKGVGLPIAGGLLKQMRLRAIDVEAAANKPLMKSLTIGNKKKGK